jgi:hypothetical protein
VGSFEDQIRAAQRKTERKLDEIARRVAFDLFRNVILETPVDKGGARANWQPSIGSPATGTIDATDKSGAATIAKVQAKIASMDAGDIIYLTNNLPYIVKLEEGGYPDGPLIVNGFSRKAPAGMVAVTVQKFQSIARQLNIEIGKQ